MGHIGSVRGLSGFGLRIVWLRKDSLREVPFMFVPKNRARLYVPRTFRAMVSIY